MKRIGKFIGYICLAIMAISSIAVLNACSDDTDDDFRRVNDTEHEIKNIVGNFYYEDKKWWFTPVAGDYSPWLPGGDCESSCVRISNWNPDWEDLKDGCIVQGYWKEIGWKPFFTGGVTFFDLRITKIESYDIEEKDWNAQK